MRVGCIYAFQALYTSLLSFPVDFMQLRLHGLCGATCVETDGAHRGFEQTAEQRERWVGENLWNTKTPIGGIESVAGFHSLMFLSTQRTSVRTVIAAERPADYGYGTV